MGELANWWMTERTDKRMEGWMDRRMDLSTGQTGQTDGLILESNANDCVGDHKDTGQEFVCWLVACLLNVPATG